MPAKRCHTCGGFAAIPSKDLSKVELRFGFHCSPRCILEEIRKAGDVRPLDSLIKGYHRVRAPSDLDPPEIWSYRFDCGFRSHYEVAIAHWLTDERVIWEFEPFAFRLANGGSYTPDFLTGHGAFLEVKGLWTFGQKSKLDRFIAEYPGVRLIVIPWTLRPFFGQVVYD
jgi:hypothetical protein